MTRIFLIVLILTASCKKSSDQIPGAAVDFYIYLSQPEFANLNTVGNHAYVTGGVKGVIVYHKNIDEFVAFERACPYDPNESGAIIELDSVSTLDWIDYHCGSKFNILDGSIENGPSTYPLRKYACDYDGVSTLHIHN